MTTKRKSYHHGDLRAALMEEAMRLLVERGGPHFSMRELTSELGVSHSASYRHFTSKESLLQAIAIEGFVRLGEFQKKATASQHAPLERLQQLGISYVKFALKYPSHFRVMFGPSLSDAKQREEWGNVAQQTFAPVIEQVRVCQEARKFKAGNAEEIALTLWAVVHGLAMLLIDGQIALASKGEAPKSEDLIEAMTGSIMRGFER